MPLKGMDETKATIERAVELGWAILRSVSPHRREAALTEEGRRRARIGR